MKTALLIMAAGMGSRFGGLKQAAPIGPNGEMIIDYSVLDALSAGFEKIVLVIRQDIEKDFRSACGKRIEKIADVTYVYQEMDMLPPRYALPSGRLKPWGTGHAVLCAKNALDCPFAVINADDFYGPTVYKSMHDSLLQSNDIYMAGYKLGNTLSKCGTVSRGICEREGGFLKSVTEVTDIPYDTDIPKNTTVSMNLWGFQSDALNIFEEQFDLFLDKNINEPKTEFYIPSVVDTMINKLGLKARVIDTDEKWYGITYKEDLPLIKSAISDLTAKGFYK